MNRMMRIFSLNLLILTFLVGCSSKKEYQKIDIGDNILKVDNEYQNNDGFHMAGVYISDR